MLFLAVVVTLNRWDITSKDFLIDSRLFGFGVDGTVVLSTGDFTVGDGGNGSGGVDNSFTDVNGGTGKNLDQAPLIH